MSKNEFVLKYYQDIRNACGKYYKIASAYIDFDDYFQNVCLDLLYRKSFDENLNVKPFTFICVVAKSEALQIRRMNQLEKRRIEKDKLLSIDFLNEEKDFRENCLAQYEDDDTIDVTKEIIEKIREKLSPRQSFYFDYMLQEFKPREVVKITGDNGNTVRKQYDYIRQKARKVLKYYNLIIK